MTTKKEREAAKNKASATGNLFRCLRPVLRHYQLFMLPVLVTEYYYILLVYMHFGTNKQTNEQTIKQTDICVEISMLSDLFF